MNSLLPVKGLRMCYMVSYEPPSLQLTNKLAQNCTLDASVPPRNQNIHVSTRCLAPSEGADCLHLVVRVTASHVEKGLLHELKHPCHFLAGDTLLEVVDILQTHPLVSAENVNVLA